MTFLNSAFTVSIRFAISEFEFRSVVSSANKKLFSRVQEGKSLIYNKNNNGPRIDPWGTPRDRVRSVLIDPSILTNCLRQKR